MELHDKPGIIIIDEKTVIRTTKVKKYITKNKIEYKEIRYLETLSDDFREVERSLKALENDFLGLDPIKEKTVQHCGDLNDTKYYFWNNKIKGWYVSKYNDLHDYIGKSDDLYLIGQTIDNESEKETIIRLWPTVLHIICPTLWKKG